MNRKRKKKKKNGGNEQHLLHPRCKILKLPSSSNCKHKEKTVKSKNLKDMKNWKYLKTDLYHILVHFST